MRPGKGDDVGSSRGSVGRGEETSGRESLARRHDTTQKRLTRWLGWRERVKSKTTPTYSRHSHLTGDENTSTEFAIPSDAGGGVFCRTMTSS